MATVEPYTTKSGKRYRVRYRTPDHRQTDRRGFRTKRDAMAFASSVEVSKMKGEYVAPADARTTIGELGDAWLSRQTHLKPSSYRPVEAAWRLRVGPRWGGVRLGDVRTTAVQTWVSELGTGCDGKPVGATVVIRTYQVLAAILDDAVRDRLIASNPARGIKLPRKPKKRPVYLTHDQVGRLAQAAGPYEPLVLMLAYTGLRWGEATGMRVRDLNLLKRRATVDENAVEVGSDIIVGTPKGHKRRTVPLPAFLVHDLARQCENKGPSDLVFSDESGNHLRRPHTKSGWFDKAVAAADVPRVTPHDLRHTAASLAVSAGVNVKALQRMLGHASAAMTLDVYADLFDEDLESVANALSDARAEASVGKMWAASAPTDEQESLEQGFLRRLHGGRGGFRTPDRWCVKPAHDLCCDFASR
ncbi:integrase [Rhodococcus aetherivorans]|uniref:Integrase n=1 Tax=Rhodococcus aetherivorans TaxID=191292 RepID=A0ABQ0YQ53_9NOCA|nr:site-specific integrase [Rhodococcus aetherivorans]ETT25284.1 integrase family protein [Rhodococcus rhodochrous ATCC 21198]NGP28443.1 site-specific integrase [Rhodococcus aetherivorans]GES38670.1 integrase [Rhodococcus aetherivorans]